ncbi:MAG: AmmeMemoRadiSam system protein A [Nitrospirae bacterium]|nr:AmmeMemoRadiSam system protein A [Nitrospirota bacterium]
MHPVVILAKKSIEEYIKTGKIIDPPEDTPHEMKGQAGVFVSLKKKGQLRGCIGTFMPAYESVAKEIIMNAIAAATRDPRFPPVRESEINEITYSVDILSAPEKVNHLNELDPKKYGIIVISGIKKGLLLPDLEGVNTIEEQINIAKMKAGINHNESVDIYRFEVRRYK